TWEQIAESLRTSNWNHTDSGNFVPANMSRTAILDKENGIKAVRHKLHGLKDPTIMAKKSRADMDLQRRVMAVGRLAKKHGDLWQRIDGVVQQRRLHEAKARFHTPDASPVLDVVVAIVRMCDPSEKEVTRIQARKKVEMWAGGSISPNGIFIAYCLDHMVRARKWLPENDPYLTKVLAGQSAAEYWNATSGDQSWNDENWLGYPEPRMSLVESGWNGIKKSKDPIVIAARELATLMRKNEELSLRLDSEEQSLKTELAHALLSCYGDEISPDATGTLRFSDGVVKQVDSNRSRSPYRTTFYGLYDRNAGFDNERPFSLPRTWLDRKDSIDMTKPINFISTNDTTIGNTGSVVVNKALEVVGVVIDGNMESLRSEFVFDNEAVRTVSVHVDGIMEALVKIYDAQHLARELTGRTIE
ncbi:MAG: S46 family peptidase, partial [Phycisphaerae bacterium]